MNGVSRTLTERPIPDVRRFFASSVTDGAAAGNGRLALVTRAPLPDGWLGDLPGARLLGTAPDAAVRGHGYEVAIDHLPLGARVLERAAMATEVLEFHLHRPDLQDVFLQLTGRGLRD